VRAQVIVSMLVTIAIMGLQVQEGGVALGRLSATTVPPPPGAAPGPLARAL